MASSAASGNPVLRNRSTTCCLVTCIATTELSSQRGIAVPPLSTSSKPRGRATGSCWLQCAAPSVLGNPVQMAFGVVIVDDNRPFLDAARLLLEREGVRAVGVASTSAEALGRAEELRPEVALAGITLAGESGFELARRMAEHDRSGGLAVVP